MEASTQHATTEQKIPTAPDDKNNNSPSAILFTSFGIGKSYIFHVKKNKPDGQKDEKKAEEPVKAETKKRDFVLECWKEIFDGHAGWKFDKLDQYYKPLGETATFTFSEETYDQAKIPKEELRKACETELSATLEKIEAVFFTTGVAVLVLSIKPKQPSATLKYALEDEENFKEVHKWTEEIIKLCKAQYINLMSAADDDEGDGKPPAVAERKWFLSRFKEVDRKSWEPRQEFSYPLFFVDNATYEQRIRDILKNVAGSERQLKRQSDEARVTYKGAEIYVDWSEALVNDLGKSRELIENNFIIALASWYALVLMNKNSSMFLFEAYIGTVADEPQSAEGLQIIANAVNQRNMAYKDVADSSLPIRWTTRRRDLFLLETIHRNWSSDRWRGNIEERMKLLVLHYRNLEDKRRRMEDDRRHTEDERRLLEDDRRRTENEKRDTDQQQENERREISSKNFSFIAVLLTAVTLVSAIGDLINLADNNGGNSSLKKIGFYISLAILSLLVVALLLWFLWLKPKPKLRVEDNKNKQSEANPNAGVAPLNKQ